MVYNSDLTCKTLSTADRLYFFRRPVVRWNGCWGCGGDRAAQLNTTNHIFIPMWLSLPLLYSTS